MYSSVLRVHQKIDRAAYRQLQTLVSDLSELHIKDIIHFEGKRGPDATKLKKGENEAPWHFYDPGGDNEEYITTVEAHYSLLVDAIKSKNSERAGFEASWLAHALVDGLTPAHHYPYKEALDKLYGKDVKKSRKTVGHHFVVKGISKADTIKRSYKLVGPKGLLTTHTTFEAGAALIILPLSLTNAKLESFEVDAANGTVMLNTFKLYAREIKDMQMYERFYKFGWTPGLVRDVRLKLAPRMVQMVALAWLSAYKNADRFEV